MELHATTLDIIDYIIHYDFYDTLTSDEISKRAGSHDELNKIRAKSKEHLAQFFVDANFYNKKNQLLPLAELKEIITAKISGFKEKELDEFVKKLKKDAKKIKALHKEVTK
ncbi:hypothetical protein [Mucilaginibacter paludis]|uniref:Uncharacterized protein n=1 Tax=Mucilaginibacter paludis DSM 18603 TaxID=714943 RepID=H1YHV5_9SPHI|nr:hypothetical protein [Mucilaginibacter paludis]EHQ27505.1 hypothetical protein Mucpa_3406 [Mucilaginibacter paludis DSM 18603]